MLVTIEGPMGCGKSGTAAWLAFMAHKMGRVNYSNILFSFPHNTFDEETFFRLNDSKFELTNCHITADEGYLYADARRSMSKQNEAVSYYVVQTRKRGVDMVFTTHSFDRLDKRIRSAVTMRITPRFVAGVLMGADGKPIRPSPSMDLLPEEQRPRIAVDKEGNPKWLRGPMFRLTIRRLDIASMQIVPLNALPIFKLYDTEEIVKVPEKSLRRKE